MGHIASRMAIAIANAIANRWHHRWQDCHVRDMAHSTPLLTGYVGLWLRAVVTQIQNVEEVTREPETVGFGELE